MVGGLSAKSLPSCPFPCLHSVLISCISKHFKGTVALNFVSRIQTNYATS